MSDMLFSNDLINTKNLNANAIEGHAEQFNSTPLKLLKIQDFLSPDFANSCADFLNNDAKFKDVYGLYSPNGNNVSLQQWTSSDQEKHFYFYQMLTSPESNHILGARGLHFLKLRQLLSSNNFKLYVEKLIRTELGTVTPIKVHRMRPQHFLNPHNDKRGNRLIAFILYLSPQWQAESGGQLCILDNNNSKTIIEADFNSLLLFDVTQHQHHYVSRVISTRNQTEPNRLSINGWFHHA